MCVLHPPAVYSLTEAPLFPCPHVVCAGEGGVPGMNTEYEATLQDLRGALLWFHVANNVQKYVLRCSSLQLAPVTTMAAKFVL